ncbi:MAG: flagellar hook-basal body complex protein FliE [Planctomycetes bacterium]|nr:flagellar hook-basal body complex protein FliE [Planctomycetota bacterium]
MPIDPMSIVPTRPAISTGASQGPLPGTPGSFKEFLISSMDEVNRMSQAAEAATDALAAGKTDNLAEVYSAVAQSKVAFDLMLEVRNKLVDAYNEVLRIRT